MARISIHSIWRAAGHRDAAEREKPSGRAYRQIRIAAVLCASSMSWGTAASPGQSLPGEDGATVAACSWTTSSRLLKLGEAITMRFALSQGGRAGDLLIYPRYLETADPGPAFKAGGSLDWMNDLESESVKLDFKDGQASWVYTPAKPGSYLARWKVGDEWLCRYFSVIEDDSIVLSFSTFWSLESEPTLHATGIPLDYRLPVAEFGADRPQFQKLLGYNRRYGDLLVPVFDDTPGLGHQERVRVYGDGMKKVRALLPDPHEGRSIWVVSRHHVDPGYPRAFAEIGVNDHCGLQEANCRPWLGMPEFPYFSSPDDSRKVNQQPGGSVVAHQWDFCGGFHFLGPVQWHYAASEGRIEFTQECVRRGMDEFKNLAAMSGHPAFVTPLYDGVMPNPGYPNPVFGDGYGKDAMFRFVEAYQRLFAFELPKGYKVVFARSIDIVDYYRGHFTVTPRTILVSKSTHLLYDAWWTQCALLNYGVLTTPQKIPWVTRISTVHKMRNTATLPHLQPYVPLKDPLSSEFILIEEQKRAIRFERECPNPIWWFDYTRPENTPQGSVITAVETPDVLIGRSQQFDDATGLTIKLTMNTQSSFPGYAIALWNLPVSLHGAPEEIHTSAARYELVGNTDGETHMILSFDMTPNVELEVVLRKPTAKRWDW